MYETILKSGIISKRVHHGLKTTKLNNQTFTYLRSCLFSMTNFKNYPIFLNQKLVISLMEFSVYNVQKTIELTRLLHIFARRLTGSSFNPKERENSKYQGKIKHLSLFYSGQMRNKSKILRWHQFIRERMVSYKEISKRKKTQNCTLIDFKFLLILKR